MGWFRAGFQLTRRNSFLWATKGHQRSVRDYWGLFDLIRVPRLLWVGFFGTLEHELPSMSYVHVELPDAPVEEGEDVLDPSIAQLNPCRAPGRKASFSVRGDGEAGPTT